MTFYSMFAAVELINLILLWAVALIRIPIAIRSSPSLLWCLAMIVEALSMTISHPSVGLAVNDLLGIPNIETLLKHLLYVAFQSLLVSNLIINQRRRLFALWIYTGLTVLVMTVGFSYDYEKANTFLLPERPGVSGLFSYSAVYVLYSVLTSVSGLVLFARLGHRAESKILRAGVGFLTASFMAGICYAGLRASLLFAIMSPVLIAAVLLVMYVGLLLFSIGSLLSALPEYSNLVWTYRSHRKLYPLWRDLTKAMPEIALMKPAGVLRGLSPGGLDLRLQRDVIETLDGLRRIREYIPIDLPPRALQFVEGKDVPTEAVDVAADACVLNVALRAKVAGREALSPTAANPYRLNVAGENFYDEARRLCELASAYRGSYVGEFAEACESERLPKSTTSN